MDQVKQNEEEEMNMGTFNYGFKPIDKVEEKTPPTEGFMTWK